MKEEEFETRVAPMRRGAVAVIGRQEKLLVVRRSRDVIAPGKLCFPGGGIENGESEPETLIRELQEELGVWVRPGRCLWRSVTSWNVELAWWSAELNATAELRPNAAEVEAIFWFAPQELLTHDDLLSSNRQFLKAVVAGDIQLGTEGESGGAD